MTIAQRYVPHEKIVQVVTRDMVMDIRPNAIERAFHLPASDSFISMSYESASRWYREHQEEVGELI